MLAHGHDHMRSATTGMRGKTDRTVPEQATKIIAFPAEPSDGVVENWRHRTVVFGCKHKSGSALFQSSDEVADALEGGRCLFAFHGVDGEIVGVERDVLNGVAKRLRPLFDQPCQIGVVAVRSVDEHKVCHGGAMEQAALSLAVSNH